MFYRWLGSQSGFATWIEPDQSGLEWKTNLWKWTWGVRVSVDQLLFERVPRQTVSLRERKDSVKVGVWCEKF